MVRHLRSVFDTVNYYIATATIAIASTATVLYFGGFFKVVQFSDTMWIVTLHSMK